MRKKIPAPIRFERFVQRDPNSGCWLWEGKRSWDYGYFWDGSQNVRAHRWSYEQVKGPIPPGLEIDHLCRQPSCVNPDHLEAVTGRVNVLRGNTLPAFNAAKTHCIHGHPFSEGNTLISGGFRYCRTCQRRRARETYVRRTARAT